MSFAGLEEVNFYISLGYVTLIASVLTMLIMELYKKIIKRNKTGLTEMSATEKDVKLSAVARTIALVMYSLIYLGNEFYLKHTIIIDGTLLTGLLSGATITLTTSKGIYTSIHQMTKKKKTYKELNNIARRLKKDDEQVWIIKNEIN